MKQFIRSKPIRFGFKLWTLCKASDYCYNFDLYCGKSVQEGPHKDLVLGCKVVLKMVDVVTTPQSRCLFFDNLFTGYDLLVHLIYFGYRATGTMRENRIKNCPLKSASLMKKEERRLYDYRFDTKNEILIVKWSDNKCVIVSTNYVTVQPVGQVLRWKKNIKEKGYVP